MDNKRSPLPLAEEGRALPPLDVEAIRARKYWGTREADAVVKDLLAEIDRVRAASPAPAVDGGSTNCPVCGWNKPHTEHATEAVARLSKENRHLRILARETAYRNHLAHADVDGFGCREGHRQQFSDCPHGDCAMVNAGMWRDVREHTESLLGTEPVAAPALAAPAPRETTQQTLRFLYDNGGITFATYKAIDHGGTSVVCRLCELGDGKHKSDCAVGQFEAALAAPAETRQPPAFQPTEHLAFVAVMNALDVHMPPDGAKLMKELREIAATVGYPWGAK